MLCSVLFGSVRFGSYQRQPKQNNRIYTPLFFSNAQRRPKANLLLLTIPLPFDLHLKLISGRCQCIFFPFWLAKSEVKFISIWFALMIVSSISRITLRPIALMIDLICHTCFSFISLYFLPFFLFLQCCFHVLLADILAPPPNYIRFLLCFPTLLQNFILMLFCTLIFG